MKRQMIGIAAGIVFSALALSGLAWADDNDPILPGPKVRGAADGLGVGSLISTAVMATPPKADGTGGDVIVWGYRMNGLEGNYNWPTNIGIGTAGYRQVKNMIGRENNDAQARLDNPRFSVVKDFNKDPNHPLYGQKVVGLFTTAYTLYAMTDSGEIWSWGDVSFGTSGCLNTGYETGTRTPNTPFCTDVNACAYYYSDYNQYRADGSLAMAGTTPHFQARPCPAFGTITPTAQVKKNVAYINGGEYNAIAFTTDQQVYTWGSNYLYQTTIAGGDGHAVALPSKGEGVNITSYFVDKDGDPERVTQVGGAYEGQYAVSVDKNGKYTLWGWGRSYRGSLVNTCVDCSLKTPTRLTQYDAYAKDIVYVNGGYGWTAVLLTDGRIYTSGMGRHLGTGHGSDCDSWASQQFTPQLIMGGSSGLPGASQLIVRYAGGIAVPLDDNQAVYTWGWSNNPGGCILTAYGEVYGNVPTKRTLAGPLKSIGATKEAIYYITTDDDPNGGDRLFGIGYNDQRTIDICGLGGVPVRTWDAARGGWIIKNSVNWHDKPGSVGGRRIPYEDWTDVVNVPYCDGVPTGYYSGSGLTRDIIRQYTNYDDGRDGPVPTTNFRGDQCRDSNPDHC